MCSVRLGYFIIKHLHHKAFNKNNRRETQRFSSGKPKLGRKPNQLLLYRSVNQVKCRNNISPWEINPRTNPNGETLVQNPREGSPSQSLRKSKKDDTNDEWDDQMRRPTFLFIGVKGSHNNWHALWPFTLITSRPGYIKYKITAADFTIRYNESTVRLYIWGFYIKKNIIRSYISSTLWTSQQLLVQWG